MFRTVNSVIRDYNQNARKSFQQWLPEKYEKIDKSSMQGGFFAGEMRECIEEMREKRFFSQTFRGHSRAKFLASLPHSGALWIAGRTSSTSLTTLHMVLCRSSMKFSLTARSKNARRES
jgi:hypothetical protein